MRNTVTIFQDRRNNKTIAGKYNLFAILFICCICLHNTVVRGQIISTVAGNGTVAFSGDGGPATAASFINPEGVTVDNAGNIIIASYGNGTGSNGQVQLVNYAGIINTVLNLGQAISVSTDAIGNLYMTDEGQIYGNNEIMIMINAGVVSAFAGTPAPGFSGDGGFATAAQLNGPTYAYPDNAGNVYIADQLNNRIRKVNSLGIISTVAGNGTAGFSGDGGPATAAELNNPYGVTVDNSGNLYITDKLNQRIRKVNTSGIITTIAGNGTAGYAGDGGPATAAEFLNPSGLTFDNAGNLYIADRSNNRVRKIATTGIITTVTGNGTAGATGDGGPATAAEINNPYDVKADNKGNLFIACRLNQSIRKITGISNYITGVATVCVGSTTNLVDEFMTGTWSSGNPGIATVSAAGAVTGVAAGTAVISYTTTSGTATDTVTVINSLPAITGATGVCIGATVALTNTQAYGLWSSSNTAVAKVLSYNGHVTGVSTGSATISYVLESGCFSTITVNSSAPAVAGTIWGPYDVTPGWPITLTNLVTGGVWTSSNPGVATAGSSSGIISGVSTGTATVSYTITNSCNSADVTRTITVNTPSIDPITGPYYMCSGTTANYSDASPGGTWSSSDPTVATIGSSDGTVTGISQGITTLSYTLGVNTTLYTINVYTAPSPIVGDTFHCANFLPISFTDAIPGGIWHSSNTVLAPIDTVTGAGYLYAYDSITVLNLVTISYTTACGTATTTVSVYPFPAVPSGPGVMCVGGSATFSDATPGGLWSVADPTGGTIDPVTGYATITADHFGEEDIVYTTSYGCAFAVDVNIYPAVPPIAGTDAICVGAYTLLSDTYTLPIGVFGPPSWASSNPGVAAIDGGGAVTGISAGTTTISYLESAAHPSIPGCSSTVVVTVSATIAGSPETIAGAGAVCPGLTMALTDATGGGVWSSSSPSLATVNATGIVTAVLPGTSTISYSITNSCGSVSATTIVTVNGTSPGTITGPSTICGTYISASLADPVSGGTWSSGNPGVAAVSGTGVATYVSGGTATISYTVGGICGPQSATYNVTAYTTPIVSALHGTLTVCAGSITSLSDDVTGGVWHSSASTIASVDASGLVTGIAPGTATINYTVFVGCTNVGVSKVVTVNACTGAGTITGSLTVCPGGTTTLTDMAASGTWSSVSPGIASVGSTGIVYGVSPGTTTISYTVGTSSVTTVVTVSIGSGSAGTITGTAAICLGGTTSLSDAVSGGIWSSGSPGVATVDAFGVVTGVSSGTAIISYNVTGSCGTAIATTMVTVSAASAGTITGATTTCAGGTVALTDAVTGGTWSSGAPGVATVSAGGIVTGVSIGTAIISYTVGGICGGTATLVVTVSAGITAGTISGTATVCAGFATTLTDPVIGGGWSSSNTLVATVSSTSGTVIGIAPGTSTIYYTVSNSCGTASASKVVTVNPSVSAGTITGSAVVCIAGTTSLTDAVTGGTWSSATPSVATVGSTGVVSGVTAGTSIISYTITSSCGTAAAATRVVTVNTAPGAGTITGTGTVCTGGTTALTDAVTGGTWNSGAPTYATVSAGGIVTGVAPGTATISYTTTNSCGSTTATTTVSVTGSSAGTITGLSSVATSSSISLTDVVGGGVWSASNSNATVSASGLVTGVTVGTVIISYTITSSCGSVSATKLITVTHVTSVAPITGYFFYLCSGATAPFFDATPSGSWDINPTSIATVSAAGVVTGVSAGTATLSYTYGGVTATAVVSVYATPAAIAGATAICSGTTTILSDATAGGTWSSSAVSIATISTAGLVTGGSTGTTTIYYAGSGGCKASMVLTVTSAPSGIGGGTSVCAGSSISLSDFTTGGTWSSSGGASVAATGSTTALATGVTAGTASITYSLGGSCYRTFNITVKVTPAPISGTLTVCTGLRTYLSDITTPGISWTSSSAAVATITASGAVTGVTVGTAIMTYMASSGCIATAIVTVNPTPTVTSILGASSVSHSGAGITLSDLTGGGIWSSSNTAIFTVGSTTGLVTAHVSTGSANINYTVTNGFGCSAAATKVISTSPAPHAHGGTATTTVGATVSLADELAAGEWTSSDNTIAIVDANGTVTAITAGNAQITHTVTNSDGTIATTTIQLVVNALPFEVRMIPNPNKGAFTISGNIGSNRDETISVEITNMLGQVVYSSNPTANGGIINEQVLLGSNLANGMYLLNVKTGNESKTLHFVIEK